jgi:phage host-nuclease inhibitor protein Gam
MTVRTKIDERVLPDVPQPEPIRSFTDADQTLLKIADCEQHLQRQEAEMNEQIQKIRDAFEMNSYLVRTTKSLLEKELEKFCITNKDEFEKVRSKDLVHGVIGFRITPPKLAPLNKKYKWDTILELIKRFKWSSPFVRTKQEVDKEGLLAAYSAKEIDDAKLAVLGIKVDQDEKFFADVKWENIPDGK